MRVRSFRKLFGEGDGGSFDPHIRIFAEYGLKSAHNAIDVFRERRGMRNGNSDSGPGGTQKPFSEAASDRFKVEADRRNFSSCISCDDGDSRFAQTPQCGGVSGFAWRNSRNQECAGGVLSDETFRDSHFPFR